MIVLHLRRPELRHDRGRRFDLPDRDHARERLPRSKAGLAHRDLVRGQGWPRLQAEWLAESGVQRALARLALDRDYPGERWVLTAADLELPDRLMQPALCKNRIELQPSSRSRSTWSKAPPEPERSVSRLTIPLIPRADRGIRNTC